MKNAIVLYFFLLLVVAVNAQEKEKIMETTEQQMEGLAAIDETAAEDDVYLQQLQHFKKHPLNLNTAGADELSSLVLLSAWQAEQLLSYRKLLGKLVNKYELQAIPGWDPATIKKILPYITITDDKTIAENLKERWTGGDRLLLARYARVLEKSKGYDVPAAPGANYYLGSRDKIFIRYSYRYKNLLQWGLLADKDAGEQFFKGRQGQGFDFYSFHFFVRKLGIIKSLAIGDFTVNFGQGLTLWQSLAFKKNADVMGIKRQAATLRPYSSAGEYNFHRGAGITLQKGNWEATVFGSFKKVSANTLPDSITDNGIVAAFNTSGYHRTAAENEDRNSLQQTAGGANLQYQGERWQAGISSAWYHFSKPLQKAGYPYQLFALQGRSFITSSIDYSFTWRNIHLFGEAALDGSAHTAFINGAVISLDAKAALSLLYRNISRAYQSVNGNAFTENSLPVNENGLYTGITLKPFTVLQLDAYADVFQFPWLKYRVDGASTGSDYFVQATYTPAKYTSIYARYKREAKMVNRPGTDLVIEAPALTPRQNLRLHSSIQINPLFTLRNRVELLWYDKGGQQAGQGFLAYMEGFYIPAFGKWSVAGRLQYFETSGFDERIYTYETALPHEFSIPFYYGKGMRYAVNMSLDAIELTKKRKKNGAVLEIAAGWAQVIYQDKSALGSGLDQLTGNRRSTLQLQLIIRN